MQAVILAGGLATRLRPLTEVIPKAMLQIDGRPFLEYQLDLLLKGEVKDIVLCVGYLGEQVEGHFKNGSGFGVSIKYSYDGDKLLGTAGAIKKAESLLSDEFFIMYGDSYLSLDYSSIMSVFNKKDKLGLMTIYKNYNQYDKSNIDIDGDLISEYSKTGDRDKYIYIDYGASIIRRKTLELVPAGQVFSLEELYQQLIKQKELLSYQVNKRFYEIGSAAGLKEFKEYISQAGNTN